MSEEIMTITVVFTGPAGSGKTTLVFSYSKWVEENLNIRIATVNLDPGAEDIPYKPVFDIRNFFTLKDIMKKYGLGPNGAFIKASDLIAESINIIMNNEPFINIDKYDIVLIDTPGQMEIFMLRPASNVLFEKLKKISKPIIVFVLDGTAMENVVDALTLWFINVLIHIKTGIYVIPVINKADLMDRIEFAKILIENPESLLNISSDTLRGLINDIFKELVEISIKTKGPLRTVFVSATKGFNIDALHGIIHEAFCACGDLT
ncbi:MAG: ATP/GTP-binding protein [Desulfurococcaceae archaeon]